MIELRIINFLLVLTLLIIGIETIIKIKKSEGKLIKDVKKPLLIRIDIIIVLISVLSVLTLVNVIING